jgi:hypothetical protein
MGSRFPNQLGSGDESSATSASFYSISGLAADPAGNLFIAERSALPRARIRRVDSSGVILRGWFGLNHGYCA